MNADSLEPQITEWRSYVVGRGALSTSDVAELEDHLRSQVAELGAAGLRPDEAFLIAVKRMGNLDELSREFAREHSGRLWKQLVLTSDGSEIATSLDRNEIPLTIGFAVAAAVAVKLPVVFGLDLDADAGFYLRNVGLLVLAVLTAFFAWRRRLRRRMLIILVVPFLVGAMVVNTYPFEPGGSTELLVGLHLPIVLWLTVGIAYLDGDWKTDRARMDFVRFSGEWLIYYVLIALGGGVLSAVLLGTFAAVDIDASLFLEEWLLPTGAAGSVIVAAWLVEAKQSLIENLAPMLAQVFTPLFAALLVALLGAIVWTGNGIDIERDLLIVFDVVLVVVLGLVLYAISARDSTALPALRDWLQLILLTSALLLDLFALAAIGGRISEFGFTPNRTAGLGLNLVLLANLAWSAWHSIGFLRGRRPFIDLERWQTGYIPVYAAWAAIVVVLFPVVFWFS